MSTTNSLSRFSIIKPNRFASIIPSISSNCYPTQVSLNRRRFVTYSMNLDNESPAKNPGLRSDPPDEATKEYSIQQVMIRIKDPKASLEFYSKVLGMSLLQRYDFPDMKFSLYFVGYEDTSSAPTDPDERTDWTFSKKALIELTHNWGTENDPEFQYHHGNSEPRGFGHIGITVDDLQKACSRFEKLGVPFVKRPHEGRMMGITILRDPDGYWIELLDFKGITNVAKTADQ